MFEHVGMSGVGVGVGVGVGDGVYVGLGVGVCVGLRGGGSVLGEVGEPLNRPLASVAATANNTSATTRIDAFKPVWVVISPFLSQSFRVHYKQNMSGKLHLKIG